jgi:hypothetical protein
MEVRPYEVGIGNGISLLQAGPLDNLCLQYVSRSGALRDAQ